MDHVLERLLEDLESITGGHIVADGRCPVADDGDGHCDTCHVLDQVIEAAEEARYQRDRVRLGVAA